MATDSKGLGIPLPADSTKISDFPRVAREGFEAVAEVLAGEVLPAGLKAAATQATREAIASADLVTGDDERLPLVLPDRPQWADVEVDGEGRVIVGRKTDGTLYVRKLESPGTVAADDVRLPQPTTSIPGWEHLNIDKTGQILSGLRSNGTNYVRGLDTAAAPDVLPAKIAVYGDSMAGDHGGTGVSFASALADVTGVEVHRGGVPGQTSTEAALRQGGLDVFLTVAGGRIPADAAAVSVTVVSPAGIWKTGSAWNFAGTLAGVAGTLRKDAADAWTFTRATAGPAVACKPETRWIADGAARAGWIQIFRAGKNSTNAAAIRRDALAVTAGMAAGNNRYLILPVYNSTSEPAGSNGYNTQTAINADHADRHGPHYYDLRGWLIRNGLAAAGITPTAEDRTAIAEDRIPPSLMFDQTHLTATGRRIEAERIAELLTDKGWLKP